MKITKITIENYRSVKHEVIVPSKFNIFVGQNNHGKTNIFEAVEWFFNGSKKDEPINDIRYGRTGKSEVFVEIEFSGALEGVEAMRNEGNKTKIRKLLDKFDTVAIRRTSNDPKTRIIILDGKQIEKNPAGFDNTLNDFLPKFEYVDTKKFYEELVKYGKNTPIGSMLSGVLEVLLQENDDYKEFREKFDELFGSEQSQIKAELDNLSGKVKIYLEKQFPECVKVEFTVRQPAFEELLKNFTTTIDDGVVTNADEKGDGMQRALMLAIIQTYADFRKENEDVGKSFLFFIDEAELHLHPTAQRSLKNALYELSLKGDQVFINTHSSVFVADEFEFQEIFKVEKVNKKTGAKPIKVKDKQTVVYELLGGSPSDLLLPKNFLIVEGRSEEAFLTGIVKRFYSSKPTIQIIFASGDINKQEKSMDAINTAYIPLGVRSSIYKERLVILCDKPKNEKKENDKKRFLSANKHLEVNGQYFELPLDALEKYYPKPWVKTDTEIKRLDKEMDGKMLLAKDVVSQNIKQDQFEKEMPILFQALMKCWEFAYK
ncbi:MAG: AAA family ATPase [Patescibacteria group bacterium]|nr:ATP-binding protein [Patescibacteria group bacterium]